MNLLARQWDCGSELIDAWVFHPEPEDASSKRKEPYSQRSGVEDAITFEGREALKRLLARDPKALHRQGADWLERAARGNAASRKGEVILTLVREGANPIATPELARIWLENDYRNMIETLVAVVLAREAQGNAVRCSDGGNLLHALGLRPNVMGNSDILRSRQDADRGIAPEIHAKWWQETDTAGRTPLHVVWGPGLLPWHVPGSMTREDINEAIAGGATPEAAEAGKLKELMPWLMEWRWRTTMPALAAGADLRAVEAEGQSVAQLINARAGDAEIPRGAQGALWSTIQAILLEQALDNHSAPALATAPRGARL